MACYHALLQLLSLNYRLDSRICLDIIIIFMNFGVHFISNQFLNKINIYYLSCSCSYILNK